MNVLDIFANVNNTLSSPRLPLPVFRLGALEYSHTHTEIAGLASHASFSIKPQALNTKLDTWLCKWKVTFGSQKINTSTNQQAVVCVQHSAAPLQTGHSFFYSITDINRILKLSNNSLSRFGKKNLFLSVTSPHNTFGIKKKCYTTTLCTITSRHIHTDLQ